MRVFFNDQWLVTNDGNSLIATVPGLDVTIEVEKTQEGAYIVLLGDGVPTMMGSKPFVTDEELYAGLNDLIGSAKDYIGGIPDLAPYDEPKKQAETAPESMGDEAGSDISSREVILPGTMVAYLGGEYELVSVNPDGTYSLRSEGGEFDTGIGEEVEPVGVSEGDQSPNPKDYPSAESFAEAYVKHSAAKFARRLKAAEDNAARIAPDLPAGVSPSSWLLGLKRRSSQEREAQVELRVAMNAVETFARGSDSHERELAEAVWQKLHKPAGTILIEVLKRAGGREAVAASISDNKLPENIVEIAFNAGGEPALAAIRHEFGLSHPQKFDPEANGYYDRRDELIRSWSVGEVGEGLFDYLWQGEFTQYDSDILRLVIHQRLNSTPDKILQVLNSAIDGLTVDRNSMTEESWATIERDIQRVAPQLLPEIVAAKNIAENAVLSPEQTQESEIKEQEAADAQGITVPEAWTVDRDTWVKATIESSEYAEAYMNDPEAYEDQVYQLQPEWLKEVHKRALIGRVSDVTLDDIFNREGIDGLNVFRGEMESGVVGYLLPAVRGDRESFLHAGRLIYPTVIGQARIPAWAVQATENIGTSRKFGDTLHDDIAEAKEVAEELTAKDEKKAVYKAEVAEQKAAAEAAKRERKQDRLGGFIGDDVEEFRAEKIRQNLESITRLSGGEAKTIRAHVEAWHAEGKLNLEIEQERKIKDPSSRSWFRMDQKEQDAFKKRQEAAGYKDVFYINGYDLGKTAYQYASYLSGLNRDLEATTPTIEKTEPELVDEHDPSERIRASVAGESPDRTLLILLADMLETATDVMNGEEFPPAAINSAVELLERIEGVIESESDTAPVLIDAAELIDEWLGSEDFVPDANAFRAVQAKIAELITPDVVENSRADEIQKAPDAERDAIKTAEANEAVTPIDDAGKNAPDQIEEAKKSAFYRNNVFASVVEPARQAVPFHQALEEMKTALENVTSIYDKQTGGLTDHGKHLVNALRQAEKEHVNPFDIVTLPPELNGYRQVMEDTAPSAKAEYERAFDMLHADFVAETIRTINAEKKESSMTAEKELRAQVMDAYRSLDVKTEWFPAEITLNNQTAKVLVSIGKIPTGAQQLRGIDIPIYILQLKAGMPMAGLPLEIISNVYKLSGRNELSLNSTRSATPSDIAGFISAGIGLPADLASVLKADRVNQTEFELRLNGRYLAGEAKIDQRLETTSTSVLGLLAASGVDAADVKEAAIDFRPGDDLWNAQTGPALLSCLMDAVRNDSEIVTVTTKNLSDDDLAIYAAAGFRSPDEFNETLFATVSDALENQLEGSVVPQKPAKANLGIQLGDTPTIRRNTVESDGEHTHYRYQLIVPGGSFPHNVAGGADVTLNAPKAGTGTIDLFAEPDDAAPATAAIDFFDINEKHQGAGYGTRLLNYIEQDCAANGADTVLLRTSTAGIEKWFEDRGYVGTGMVPRQKAVSAGSVMDRVCADLIDWSDIPEKKPTSSGLVATMYRESRVLLELTELEKLFLGKLSEAAKSAGQSGLLQAAEAGAMIRTLRGKKASINPVKLTAYAALLLPDMATMPEDKATPKIKVDYAWRMLIDTAGLSDAPEHKNATGVKLDENMVYPRPEGPATEVADLQDDIVELNIPVETLGEYLNEFEHLMEDAEKREHAGKMRNKDESSPEFMTPEAAASIVASWKSHAKEQGLNTAIRRRNSDKWVISLFDYTGEWAKPWAEAGYNVLTVDLQDGIDVNDFSVEYLVELLDDNGIGINSVYMMLIATPCTDFSNSGSKHFWIKDLDGRTEASKNLVFQSLKTVEFIRPKAGWAIENPAGRIERLTGLPKARYSFHPHHFGDDYTKETVLWGRFETDLPTANTFPVAGSKMHTQYGGSSIETKNARSATPEGFAYAFFMANNYEDLTPAQRLKMDFKQVSGAVLAADAAGIPESTIRVLAGIGYGDEDYDLSRTVIAKAVHCINEGISVDDLVYGIDRAAGSFNDVTAIINAVDDLVESTGYAPAQDDVQPPSDEELYAELTEGDNKTGIFTPDSAPWADRNLLATNDWYGSIVNLTMTSGEQITGGFIEEARGSMMRVSTIEDPAGRVILPNDVATMELVSLSHFPDAGQKLLNKGKTWVRKGSAEQKLKAWGLEGSYYVEGNGNPDRAWWLQKMPDIHRSQFAELEDVIYVGEQLGTKVAFYLNDQDEFSVDMVRKAIKHYDYLALRRVEGREINSKEWAILVSPEEQHLLDALFAKAERPAEMKLSREVQIRAAVNKVIQAGSPSDEIPVTVKTGSDVENLVVRLGRRPSAARQFEGYQVPLEVNWLAINGKGELVGFGQKINGKNAITDPVPYSGDESWLIKAYERAGFDVPGSEMGKAAPKSENHAEKSQAENAKDGRLNLEPGEAENKANRIEDTGYIYGAIKERWAAFRKAFENKNPDFINKSFGEIFPIPDYLGLIADGYKKDQLAMVAVIRAAAAADKKPRRGSRTAMDKWASKQKTMFAMASNIIFEDGYYSLLVEKIITTRNEELHKLLQTSKLLCRLPDEKIHTASRYVELNKSRIRDISEPDGVGFEYNIKSKKKFLGVEWYRDMNEVPQSKINQIIELVDEIELANKNRSKSEIKVEIIGWSVSGYYAVYKPRKSRNSAVKLERVPEDYQESYTSAYEWLSKDGNEERLINYVEETRAYKMRHDENAERESDHDWRLGRNINQHELKAEFGLRDIQFGNSTIAAQKEAQERLNHTYDALCDLAEVLSIDRKAIGLNGSLALAFGARGRGGAGKSGGKTLAHYEPGEIVINLTRANGAGTLAHEWFHAVDNYFSKLGIKGEYGLMLSHISWATEAAIRDKRRPNPDYTLRQEIKDAFLGIYNSVNKSAVNKSSQERDGMLARSTPYWSQTIEMCARCFEAYVKEKLAEKGIRNDFLVNLKNDIDPTDPENLGGVVPTAFGLREQGIYDAFDDLFKVVQQRETEAGMLLFRKEDPDFTAAAYAWAAAVSEEDYLFRFGIEVGDTIQKIFEASGFDVTDDRTLLNIMKQSLPQDYGSRLSVAWLIGTPQQDPVYIYETDSEVWLDVSSLTSGVGGGAEIYQMAAGYALGAGKTLIGDPEGLTSLAVVRFTESMVSSALRFGTTMHIRPSVEQMTGKDANGNAVPGVMPLDWSEDDYSNIASLLKVSYNNVLAHLPEIQHVSYDIEQSKFRADRSAAETGNNAGRLADYLNGEAGTIGLGSEDVFWRRLSPVARALAGSATLKRAIVTQTLLRAAGQENLRQNFSGYVRQLFSENSVNPLTGILYSNDDAGYSSARVSVVKDWIKPVEEATGVRVQVVATSNDLPARIAGQLNSSATGVYDWATRTPYIIADKVRGEAHAVKTALHEGLGHTGVIEFMRRNSERGGAEMETLLDTIFRDLGAAEIRRVVPASYSFDYSVAKDRREAVLEYIAHLAETGEKPKLVNDLAVAGRDFVEGLFGDQKWTRNDILALIETSRAYVLAEQCVKAGAGMGVSPEERARRREEAFNKVLADAGGRMEALLKANAGTIAWHGTDAFIKTFDHSKVSTGVGLQNLGYGHYLTTAKAEAERYAENVGGDQGKVHKVLLPLSDSDFLKLDAMVYQQSESVINGLETAGLYDHRLDGLYRNYLSALEHAAEGGDPDRVAAAEGLNPGDAAKREYETGLMTGADLYARVVESLTYTDEAWNMLPVGAVDSARTVQHAAALLLNKAGIPGAVVAAGKEKICVIYDETLTPVIAVNGQRLHSTSEASFLQAMSAAKEAQLDCPPAVTGTPQFQRWFGESKVVNTAGEPLVLYTGTNQSFDEFDHSRATAQDGLIYATSNPRVASDYAMYRSTWNGANVIPMYAKAEKMLEIDAEYRDIRDVELNANITGMLKGEDIKAFATRCQYDGIVYRNALDDAGGPAMTPASDIYAFFPSAQLKSATGNNGEFNPENSSILARLQGAVATQSPEFTAWFGDSKVVAEDGQPIVMYHGTGSDFDNFDHRETGGVGFYFTADPAVASEHAALRGSSAVMPVYLSVTNPAPYDVVKREYAKAHGGNPRKVAHEALAELGYDGIIRAGEVVVFSARQIKSAIGNSGEFSQELPSILAKIEDENLVDNLHKGDEMSDNVNTVPASKLMQAHPDFAQVFGHSVAIDALGSPRAFKISEGGRRGSISFVTTDALSERDSYLRMEAPAFVQKSEPFATLGSIAEKLGGGHELVTELANRFKEDVLSCNDEMLLDLYEENDSDDFDDLLRKTPNVVADLDLPIAAVFDDRELVKRFSEAGYDGAIFRSLDDLAVIDYRVFDEAQVIPVSEYPAVKGFRKFPADRHDQKLVWALEGELDVQATQDVYLLGGGAGAGISVDVKTHKVPSFRGLSEPMRFLEVVNVTGSAEQFKQDVRNLSMIANGSGEFDILVVKPGTANTLTIGVAKAAGFVSGVDGELIFPVSAKAEKAFASEINAKPVRSLNSSDRAMQRPAKEVIQQFADEVLEAQGIKEGVNVFVYDSFEDMPDVLKAGYQKPVNGVVAFGSINLLANEMTSPQTVEGSILQGASILELQTNLDIAMEAVYANAWNGFGGKEGVIEAAAQMGHDLTPLVSAADHLLKDGQITNKDYQQMVVSEVLACSTMGMNYAEASPGSKFTIREFIATTRQICQRTRLRGLPFADASEIALLSWAATTGRHRQSDCAQPIVGSALHAQQFQWEMDIRNLMILKGIPPESVVMHVAERNDELTTYFAKGKTPAAVVNDPAFNAVQTADVKTEMDTDYSPSM